MPVVVCIFAALLGAALGSFAGVVADRGWHASLAGRSHCDGCDRTLQWFEVMPLLSYPLLRGHCRSCGVRIPLSAYAWEVGGAVIALAVALPAVLLTGR